MPIAAWCHRGAGAGERVLNIVVGTSHVRKVQQELHPERINGRSAAPGPSDIQAPLKGWKTSGKKRPRPKTQYRTQQKKSGVEPGGRSRAAGGLTGFSRVARRFPDPGHQPIQQTRDPPTVLGTSPSARDAPTRDQHPRRSAQPAGGAPCGRSAPLSLHGDAPE